MVTFNFSTIKIFFVLEKQRKIPKIYVITINLIGETLSKTERIQTLKQKLSMLLDET